jgi:hypothetical protein
MKYKRTYTKQEAEALIQWFDQHKSEQVVDMGHGLVIRDIAKLVAQSRNVVLKKYDNPTYSGQIQLLFNLQEQMIKSGLATD